MCLIHNYQGQVLPSANRRRRIALSNRQSHYGNKKNYFWDNICEKGSENLAFHQWSLQRGFWLRWTINFWCIGCRRASSLPKIPKASGGREQSWRKTWQSEGQRWEERRGRLWELSWELQLGCDAAPVALGRDELFCPHGGILPFCGS